MMHRKLSMAWNTWRWGGKRPDPFTSDHGQLNWIMSCSVCGATGVNKGAVKSFTQGGESPTRCPVECLIPPHYAAMARRAAYDGFDSSVDPMAQTLRYKYNALTDKEKELVDQGLEMIQEYESEIPPKALRGPATPRAHILPHAQEAYGDE
jgi:hypothetical protein